MISRNLKIEVVVNAAWRFPGFGKSFIVPDFQDKIDPIKIDITKYVIQWSGSGQRGMPGATISMTCAPYIEIQHINRNDIIVVSQTLINGALDLIGAYLVDGITENKVVSEKCQTTYTISAREVTKLLDVSELYYNLRAVESSDPFFQWYAAGLVLGVDSTIDKGRSDLQYALKKGAPSVMIDQIIRKKALGDGTQFNGGFFLNDGRRLADWLDLSGIMDINNPDVFGAKISAIMETDPLALAYMVQETSQMTGTLWSLIQNYSGAPFCELFTYSEYQNGVIRQKIVHRPTPFYSRRYGFALWDALPVWRIGRTDNARASSSLSWSDRSDFNFFLLEATASNWTGDDIQAQYFINDGGDRPRIPVFLGKLIERYGFRRYTPTTNAIPLANTDMGEYYTLAIEEAVLRIFEHNFPVGYMLSGTITMPLPVDRPRPHIGMRVCLEETGFEYYVDAVQISGWPVTLTLSVSRGMRRDVYQSIMDSADKLRDGWKGAML